MDTRNYWHNYETGEREYRDAPHTDEEALQLLPQNTAAKGLYEIYRLQSHTILNSMLKVLTACIEAHENRLKDEEEYNVD